MCLQLPRWGTGQKIVSACISLRKSQHEPEIITSYFRSESGYKNKTKLLKSLYLCSEKKHRIAEYFLMQQCSSTLSTKVQWWSLVLALRCYCHLWLEFAGTCVSPLPALGTNQLRLGTHFTSRAEAESRLLKPEHGNCRAAAPGGLAQTNHPQSSWEQHCSSALLRHLHRSGFAPGRAVV